MSNFEDIIETGKKVILKERDALTKLADSLDAKTFLQAIDIITTSKNLQKRNFTREDFGRRHPAGKLGLRLQSVEDWMGKTVTVNPLIFSDASVKDVIFSITEGGYGCTGVIENRKLIGIVTDGDLRRAMSANFFEKKVTDIMTPAPFTVI